MKMNLKNARHPRTVSIVLTIIMLLTLAAGCATAPTTKGTTTVATTTATTTTTTTTTEPVIDPLGKYDPPIDITLIANAQSYEAALTALGEELETNRWVQCMKDELGINISYLWVAANGDQYDLKLNTALASGEIPDIMSVGMMNMTKMADAGLIQDISGALEYLSPMGKEILDGAGDVPFKQGTVNKVLYGLPWINDFREDATFIFLRTDWLANLELQPPETMDDMLAIIKAFADNDPDGNNVNDTRGLGVKNEIFSWAITLEGFFEAYGANPNIWIENNGKLEYGSIQPEIKTALAKLNELFVGGYIDPEFAVKDHDKVWEDVSSGKIGAFYGQHWVGLALPDSVRNDPDAEWLPFPIVSADDKKVMIGAGNPTVAWWVVSKNCEHPEAMVKMLNKYYEKNYDPERHEFSRLGIVSTENGKAEAWFLAPVLTYKASLNADYEMQLREPLKTGDSSKLWGEVKELFGFIQSWVKDGDVANYGWQLIYDDKSTWNIINTIYNVNEQWILDGFYGSPTPTMLTKKSTLDTMQVEVFTKIIMGQVPLDAFDQFVADWKSLGGDDITKEVNDWVAAQK